MQQTCKCRPHISIVNHNTVNHNGTWEYAHPSQMKAVFTKWYGCHFHTSIVQWLPKNLKLYPMSLLGRYACHPPSRLGCCQWETEGTVMCTAKCREKLCTRHTGQRQQNSVPWIHARGLQGVKTLFHLPEGSVGKPGIAMKDVRCLLLPGLF